MAIAKSSIFVADVTGPRGPAGSIYKGPIPNGSNINTWHTPAYEGSWTFSGSGAATLTGLPSGVVAGQLFVLPGLGGQFLTSYASSGSPEAFWFRGRTNLSGGFGSWQNLNSKETLKNRGLVPPGTNLNYWYLKERTGEWEINSTTNAQEVANLPVIAPGKLTNNAGGIATQIYQSYGLGGTAPGFWHRSIANVSTNAWSEWVNLYASGGSSGGGSSDTEQYALKHAFRLDEARKRLGYKLGTGGKAAIALQFDDYNGLFRDKVLPILREFDIPATMALAVNWVEGNVNHELNETVPWPTVQSWVLNDGVEPQSHSWTHSAASSTSQLKKEIIDSADHMEKQMPSVVIDGWSMPGTGVSSDPYGGYNGQSVKDFTETTAGKMLLSRYAFVGARKGGYLQPGGGQDIIGQSHGMSEVYTVAEFKAGVEEAIKGRYALATMHHPGWLDTSGYKTTAQLRECIQWLAAQRDAGRLVIVTRRALNVFDSTENARDNLLPGGFNGALNGWEGWSLNGAGNPSSSSSAVLSHSLTMLPIAWARGSIREYSAVVKASATSVVRLTVSGGATNATKDYTIPAGSWVEIRKFFAVPKVGGSSLTFNLSRVSGGTVEVQQINAYAA